MSARSQSGWWGTVLDAPDALVLARFYERLLGWPIAYEEPSWVTMAPPGAVAAAQGGGEAGRTYAYLAFQSNDAYVRPVWPGEDGSQQMMLHLDVGVDDLDAAVGHAVDAGAVVADFQPQDDVRVMLDPAGHPFCLYLDT